MHAEFFGRTEPASWNRLIADSSRLHSLNGETATHSIAAELAEEE
jgi:hypothetical protein